jgi:1-deoxyxylulose-5-phosphate synthase
MERILLGRTGIEVSEFCFGAGTIGGIGSRPSTRGRGITLEEGLARLDEAAAIGIRLIDTADAYAGGVSEVAVGQWLRERRPDHVLVATKTGITGDAARAIDLSPDRVARQLAQSIARLGRVDLFMWHAPDPRTPLEQTLTAFAAAVQTKQIRAYGVSNVDASLLERTLTTADRLGLPRPEFVENGLSLLNRDDEPDLLPMVAGEGLGYLAYSPLAGGVLSERYLDGAPVPPDSRIGIAGDMFYPGAHSEDNLARVARLRDLARTTGHTVSGLALAWLRAHPAVTAPIVSPRTGEQWQAVREALDTDLDDDTFGRISEIFG